MPNVPQHLRQARIVLLESVGGSLAPLQEALAAAGLENARTLADPANGLTWLLENGWDLLLLDLDMSRPGGFEVLRLLRKYLPEDQPIVAVSCRHDLDSRNRALELGVSDYLSKPVDSREMFLRLRNHLGLWFTRIELDNERRLLEQRVEERGRELARSTEEVVRCLVRVAEYRDNQFREPAPGLGRLRGLADRSARPGPAHGRPPVRCPASTCEQAI